HCTLFFLVLLPFPTRRSSDLAKLSRLAIARRKVFLKRPQPQPQHRRPFAHRPAPFHRFHPARIHAEERPPRLNRNAQRGIQHPQDRKSTRLNSSHVKISYAVL